MNYNMLVKKRVKFLFFVYLLFIGVFVGYYFIHKFYPSFALKCLLFEMTGLKCPGCGVTRLLFNFVNFNFKGGVEYNCFIGYTFPFVLFVIGYCSWVYIFDKKYSKWFNILVSVYLGLLLVFFVVRNIVGI